MSVKDILLKLNEVSLDLDEEVLELTVTDEPNYNYRLKKTKYYFEDKDGNVYKWEAKGDKSNKYQKGKTYKLRVNIFYDGRGKNKVTVLSRVAKAR